MLNAPNVAVAEIVGAAKMIVTPLGLLTVNTRSADLPTSTSPKTPLPTIRGGSTGAGEFVGDGFEPLFLVLLGDEVPVEVGSGSASRSGRGRRRPRRSTCGRRRRVRRLGRGCRVDPTQTPTGQQLTVALIECSEGGLS
jgi:hypothetical protein